MITYILRNEKLKMGFSFFIIFRVDLSIYSISWQDYITFLMSINYVKGKYNEDDISRLNTSIICINSLH